MSMRIMFVLAATLLLGGCASFNYKVTRDTTSDDGNEATTGEGLPFREQVLVEIDRTTHFKLAPGAEHVAYAKHCKDSVQETISKMMPLGERYYVQFTKGVGFGTGKFAVEFNDVGTLRALSLDSDNTAIPKAAIDATGQVLGAAIGIVPEVLAAQALGSAVDGVTTPIRQVERQIAATEATLGTIAQALDITDLGVLPGGFDPGVIQPMVGGQKKFDFSNTAPAAVLNMPKLYFEQGVLKLDDSQPATNPFESIQNLQQAVKNSRAALDKIKQFLDQQSAPKATPAQLRAAHCVVDKITLGNQRIVEL